MTTVDKSLSKNVMLSALVAVGTTVVWFVARAHRKQEVIFAKFKQGLSYVEDSEESIRNGHNFKPRAEDIFVVTYPKSGTTWMQQITHGLRTRGSMEFDEISAVVPWTETALDCQLDLDAEQVASPRLFKSHDPYLTVPKGAKYIVIVRNPADVLVSFHLFLCDWAHVNPAEFTVNAFCDRIFTAYWSHMASWLRQRTSPNVLFLFFEDLKFHLPEVVEKVAGFMGVPTDPELREIVLRQSSFEFMRHHSNQFDDHFTAKHYTRRHGYTPSQVPLGKVRAGGGKVGQGKVALSRATLMKLEASWKDIIYTEFGFKSYGDLRQKCSMFRAMSAFPGQS